MTEYNYTLEGILPRGYPEPIEHAWFPTNETCEKFDLPSFEGYMSLLTVQERYPELRNVDESLAELFVCELVENVEDCTIITGFDT
jgi:hypothetical protein